MTVKELLKRARNDQRITDLPNAAKRGAEAFFQAYEYVATGLSKHPFILRVLADSYLRRTAKPQLTEPQQEAANLARRILRQLS